MTVAREHEHARERARQFFDELWSRGDYWELGASEFERARLEKLYRSVSDRRYGRALEIGCGAGDFTRRLAALCDAVLAVDVSPAAIERARAAVGGTVDLQVASVMDLELGEDMFDLIVFAETIYYVGWLYSFFDVAWLASELFAATAAGGRLLLANTEGELEDYLVRPWIIRSYRDLFINVGFDVELEEVFRGEKNGVELDVLISLFRKPGLP